MPAIVQKSFPAALPIKEATPAPAPAPAAAGVDNSRLMEMLASQMACTSAMQADMLAMQKQMIGLTTQLAAQTKEIATIRTQSKTLTIDKWENGRIKSLTIEAK